MLIKDLLKETEHTVLSGDKNIEISNIVYNSKKVIKGSLFVCIKGFKLDGHDYIVDAVKNGAVAILVEEELKNYPEDVVFIKVENTRKVLPQIGSIFYGEPSKDLNVVGITGTNGKTSVSIFVSNILESVKRKVGIIGTIDNRIGNKVLKLDRTTPTTPESLDLQYILHEMKKEDAYDVVMEVSSMALELHRVDYCDFKVGVFTNLTQDHLDNHKTMENYKNAKLKLFTRCKYAVVNADDDVYEDILNIATAKIFTFGINNKADLVAKDIEISIYGVKFKVVFKGMEREVFVKVPGLFSVYNALAAMGTCYCLGLSFDEIVKGVSEIKGVRGRFETIPSGKGYSVIVDYAHSPDALENVINTAKEFTDGKITTVFGCGGDRDRTKRPIMGEIAGKLSDYVVITSDNPRTEDPIRILNDVEDGVKKTDCSYEKIVDRKEAIHLAMDNASIGDVIIIAGKGHETYQILKDEVIDFDDAEVVREHLKENK